MNPYRTAPPATVRVDGSDYTVVHRFSDTRAVVDFGEGDGAPEPGPFVIVDYDPAEGWSETGDPATPEETVVIQTLMAGTTDVSVLKVTKVDAP